MARLHRAVTLGVTLAAAGATLLALGAPAQADPTTFKTWAGVGSDTTQDVLNALVGGSGVTSKAGSYNAFGTATITTKSGGPEFNRPSGSGAGVQALSYSVNGQPYNGVTITGQVDFARSSSGPAAGTGNGLTYIPFARDGVSYAYKGSKTAIGALSTSQLNQVYSANTPVTINGVKVTGVLPQSASGTRKFFLAAIGVTTVGSTVVQTSSPENDGTILTATNSIVPFSAAQWIAQYNGVTTKTIAGTNLGRPNAVAPTVANGTKQAPNPTFYNTGAFGRYVYNVVPTSKVGVKNTVASLFAGPTAVFCSTKALGIDMKYGFSPIADDAPLACGSTDLTGPFTP